MKKEFKKNSISHKVEDSREMWLLWLIIIDDVIIATVKKGSWRNFAENQLNKSLTVY